MSEGIGDELHGNLGDERLNKRSKHILEALADNPEASINAACDGWGDTIAAYRFFDNTAVTPEEILRPHQEATIRRLREHPVVLHVQDTKVRDEVAGAKLLTTRTIELERRQTAAVQSKNKNQLTKKGQLRGVSL